MMSSVYLDEDIQLKGEDDAQRRSGSVQVGHVSS